MLLHQVLFEWNSLNSESLANDNQQVAEVADTDTQQSDPNTIHQQLNQSVENAQHSGGQSHGPTPDVGNNALDSMERQRKMKSPSVPHTNKQSHISKTQCNDQLSKAQVTHLLSNYKNKVKELCGLLSITQSFKHMQKNKTVNKSYSYLLSEEDGTDLVPSFAVPYSYQDELRLFDLFHAHTKFRLVSSNKMKEQKIMSCIINRTGLKLEKILMEFEKIKVA